MLMTMSDSSGPPVGIYQGQFTEVKQTDSKEYGPGVCLTWTVDTGEHKGAKCSRTGKPTPTANNIIGKLISGLMGRQMKPGESVNLAEYVGRRFTVVVGASPSGKSTRVESVMPIA